MGVASLTQAIVVVVVLVKFRVFIIGIVRMGFERHRASRTGATVICPAKRLSLSGKRVATIDEQGVSGLAQRGRLERQPIFVRHDEGGVVYGLSRLSLSRVEL